MPKRNRVSTKRDQKTRELNKKLSKKKSNIKLRHGIVIDIPRIDPTAPAKQWREQIRAVESFLNPHNTAYQYVKNEQGVSFSRKLVNQLKRETARINRIKQREYDALANMDFIIDGVSYGKMGEVKLPNKKVLDDFKPISFDLNVFQSNEGLKQYYENKRKAYSGNFIKAARIQMQQNYLQALESTFGMSSDIQPLMEKISKMSPEAFYYFIETHAGTDFTYVYDESDRDNKLESLYTDWGLDLEEELIKQQENWDEAKKRYDEMTEKRIKFLLNKDKKRKKGK